MDTDNSQSQTAIIKQPWKAVYLTKLFPGAGHIYAGARSKGTFLIVVSIVLGLLMIGGISGFLAFDKQDAARASMFAAAGAFLVQMVITLYALFDSYSIARSFNKVQNVEAHAPGQKKSWLAVFLSQVLFPGAGQFYNGQVLKGIAIIAAVFAAVIAEESYYQLFLVTFAISFYAMKEAFDWAERRNGSSERFLYQGNALLVFITIALFLHAIPTGHLIRDNWLKAYTIPAGSMIPTLEIGDHLLIDKRQVTLDNLRRGDIVVFPYPENPEKNFIKRIVALGGDKVQFVNGDLYINDQLVPRSLKESKPNPFNSSSINIYEERLDGRTHLVQYLREDLSSYNYGPFTVPQDQLFMLGDNRDNSQDSRVWGGLPRNTVEGKAIKLYWSWDRTALKVIWTRIGQKIN